MLLTLIIFIYRKKNPILRMAKTHITAFVENELLIGLMKLANKSGLSKSDIISLSLMEYLLENSEAEEIDGINLNDLARHLKAQKLRQIRGIFRNEMLSGAFFLKRVRRDLLKLMTEYKGRKDLRIILEKLILLRKKEADLFLDKAFIFKEFENFELMLEKSINSLKNYIENTVIIEKGGLK